MNIYVVCTYICKWVRTEEAEERKRQRRGEERREEERAGRS